MLYPEWEVSDLSSIFELLRDAIEQFLIYSHHRLSAATFCHPLDVIRVQMQTDGVAYKNTFDAATKIHQRAGLIEGLYVSKSLLRIVARHIIIV